MITLYNYIRALRRLRAIEKAEAKQRVTAGRLAAIAAGPSLRDRRAAQ